MYAHDYNSLITNQVLHISIQIGYSLCASECVSELIALKNPLFFWMFFSFRFHSSLGSRSSAYHLS